MVYLIRTKTNCFKFNISKLIGKFRRKSQPLPLARDNENNIYTTQISSANSNQTINSKNELPPRYEDLQISQNLK